MLTLLTCLIFILSVALASAGIILSSKLRNRYYQEIFSLLLYFEVFIFTFGFYGIWGQVFIRSFLSSFLSQEALSRLSDIAMLMGLPFLIFAWYMLLKFSGSLSGRSFKKWFVFLFLFLNFTVLIVLGFFITRRNEINTTAAVRYYYIGMNLIYFFISAYFFHLPWKGGSIVHDYDRKIIASSLFIIMMLQCTLLFFYKDQEWLALIFILVFFTGNTFLPVYFSYGTLVTELAPERKKDIPFEEFCKKFEVSPRESEVIREICKGLSNREISDKLFISLQTVKDHTHRIYIKMNVKSRVQLINFLREFDI